jgi:hypothetical protein
VPNQGGQNIMSNWIIIINVECSQSYNVVRCSTFLFCNHLFFIHSIFLNFPIQAINLSYLATPLKFVLRFQTTEMHINDWQFSTHPLAPSWLLALYTYLSIQGLSCRYLYFFRFILGFIEFHFSNIFKKCSEKINRE